MKYVDEVINSMTYKERQSYERSRRLELRKSIERILFINLGILGIIFGIISIIP